MPTQAQLRLDQRELLLQSLDFRRFFFVFTFRVRDPQAKSIVRIEKSQTLLRIQATPTPGFKPDVSGRRQAYQRDPHYLK